MKIVVPLGPNFQSIHSSEKHRFILKIVSKVFISIGRNIHSFISSKYFIVFHTKPYLKKIPKIIVFTKIVVIILMK